MTTHSTRCARSGQGRTAAAFVLILFGVSASAGAQAKPAQPQPRRTPVTARPAPIDRVYISVNGLFQTAGEDFGETVTFVENAENGTFTTSYDMQAGPAFDFSAGVLVWRNVAVGVGVTRFSHNVPIGLTASVPHPFFFNRARSVTGDVVGVTREEVAVHIQARAMFKPSPRIEAMVFGGPSFFSVKQAIVNDFEITETYPYDTATFASGVTTALDESKSGFHAGVDVGYFFTRQVGVGGSLQWAGTTIAVPASGGTGTFDLKVGGMQAGGGIRFRF